LSSLEENAHRKPSRTAAVAADQDPAAALEPFDQVRSLAEDVAGHHLEEGALEIDGFLDLLEDEDFQFGGKLLTLTQAPLASLERMTALMKHAPSKPSREVGKCIASGSGVVQARLAAMASAASE